MVKFDNTIKLVMDHVRRMLKISDIDLNRHIRDTILNPESEPSVMLKYYNEILGNSNFTLPEKRRLEFDREVFRLAITRILKAHSKEINWVRNVAINDSKSHIEKCFEKGFIKRCDTE